MRRPAYLDLPDSLFIEKVETLEAALAGCNLCPRGCGVNRLEGETGFCRTGALPVVSSWGPHFGEERPITGLSGSGTIFFTHCNLGCIYCQNYTISHLGDGAEISVERLSEIMLSLQRQGCHNINLVSPTHQVPMIVRALFLARERGLSIPLVYNTGGYDSTRVLRVLEGMVDIYMPDFKYADPEVSEKLSDAPDYPEVAKEAIREMHRQVGDLVMD
ncbi:MAG: radical SAM protein, partial [Nitrospirae bacterium]